MTTISFDFVSEEDYTFDYSNNDKSLNKLVNTIFEVIPTLEFVETSINIDITNEDSDKAFKLDIGDKYVYIVITIVGETDINAQTIFDCISENYFEE